MGEGHNSTYNSPSLKQNTNEEYTHRYDMKNILWKEAANAMISATSLAAVFIIDYWQFYIIYNELNILKWKHC